MVRGRKRWRGPRTRYARSANKSISFDRARTSCPTQTSVKPSKKPDSVSSVFSKKSFSIVLFLFSSPTYVSSTHTTLPARPPHHPTGCRRSVFVLNNQYGEQGARAKTTFARALAAGGSNSARAETLARCPCSRFRRAAVEETITRRVRTRSLRFLGYERRPIMERNSKFVFGVLRHIPTAVLDPYSFSATVRS